jgi:hypothetical protein
MARRQFMRGTDPTKSTWVYPKLIGKNARLFKSGYQKYMIYHIFYFSLLFGIAII